MPGKKNWVVTCWQCISFPFVFMSSSLGNLQAFQGAYPTTCSFVGALCWSRINGSGERAGCVTLSTVRVSVTSLLHALVESGVLAQYFLKTMQWSYSFC